MISAGDLVEIVRQSRKYNPYIKNVGYIGIAEVVGDDAVQVNCFISRYEKIVGACGAIDKDCLKVWTLDELRGTIPEIDWAYVSDRYKVEKEWLTK